MVSFWKSANESFYVFGPLSGWHSVVGYEMFDEETSNLVYSVQSVQFYFIFIFVLFLMKKHIVNNSKKKNLYFQHQ